MAARRLIAVLIVLLVVSSFAAALAPQPQSEETTTTTERTIAEADDAPEPGEGAVLTERIDASAPDPAEIEAQVGDQLELTVRVEDPSPVGIPGLGRSGFATPAAPARFDLLLRRGGTFAITAGAGDAVGELRVRR